MSVNLGTVYSALELDIKDFTSKMNEAKGQLTAFQTQSDLVSSGLTSVGSTITGIGTSLTALSLHQFLVSEPLQSQPLLHLIAV